MNPLRICLGILLRNQNLLTASIDTNLSMQGNTLPAADQEVEVAEDVVAASWFAVTTAEDSMGARASQIYPQ